MDSRIETAYVEWWEGFEGRRPGVSSNWRERAFEAGYAACEAKHKATPEPDEPIKADSRTALVRMWDRWRDLLEMKGNGRLTEEDWNEYNDLADLKRKWILSDTTIELNARIKHLEGLVATPIPEPDEPKAGSDGANVIWPKPDEPNAAPPKLDATRMMIPDTLLRAFTAVSLTVPSSGQERIDAIIRKSMLWDAAKAAMQGMLTVPLTIPGGDAQRAIYAYQTAEALVAESERRAKADPDKAEKDGKEGASCKQHGIWNCDSKACTAEREGSSKRSVLDQAAISEALGSTMAPGPPVRFGSFGAGALAAASRAKPAGKEGTLCKQHNRWHCVECATEGGGDGKG